MDTTAQPQNDATGLLGQVLGKPPFDNTQGKPPTQPVSVPNKEMPIGQSETIPLVELKEEEKIPEDVQGWVEKLQNENVKLPEPIKEKGEVVLAEPHVTFVDDKIVLPLTQQTFTKSTTMKVTDSVKWLGLWCKRLIDMLGDKVKFKDS